MRLRCGGGHIGVVAAAEYAGILRRNLRLLAVAVLCDHNTFIGADEGFRGLLFQRGIAPSADLLYIDLRLIAENGLNAERKGIDAAAGFRILRAVGGYITDIVFAVVTLAYFFRL